jgi:hypothetical protein
MGAFNRRSVGWLAVVSACAVAVSTAQAHPAHDIDDDGISASTTGASVTGTLHWLSFGGHATWTVTVRDTLSDGHCADLYVRQRNVAGASTGWQYWTRQCGAGTSGTWTGRNTPFQGGTLYFDFKIQRSGVGNYTTDLNQLGGA